MRRRGMVRLARRKAERRLAVFGCMRSAGLAVKRMFFQKRVVFFLFQPVRCARALLVSRRHVTRNGFTQSFSLGAFQCDNFLRHKINNLLANHFGVIYSFSAAGAGCSSSVSGASSSSVKPKSEVTDCRTREALFCFSSCDWHLTVKRANGIASRRARGICLPDISQMP